MVLSLGHLCFRPYAVVTNALLQYDRHESISSIERFWALQLGRRVLLVLGIPWVKDKISNISLIRYSRWFSFLPINYRNAGLCFPD